MKVVRTPLVGQQLRAMGHELVVSDDGVSEDEVADALADADLL